MRPEPIEPYWLWQGRTFFWSLGLMGVLAFLGSFLEMAKGLREAIAMAVLGAGPAAFCGATILPFGASLLMLVLRHRRKKETEKTFPGKGKDFIKKERG